MQNKDFRQAINFAFDRHAYAAQTNGEDGADRILRNTITPSNFVQVGDKNFGDIVNEKIVNYGKDWANINLNDGKQSLLESWKGQKRSLPRPKKSLQAQGVTFPIHLDMPVDQTAKLDVQQAGSFKQTVEETLGKENVVTMLSNFLQMKKTRQPTLQIQQNKKTTISTSQDGVETTQTLRLT